MTPTFHKPKFDSPFAKTSHISAKGASYAQLIMNWAMRFGPDSFPQGLDQAATFLMNERFPYRKWASETTIPEIGRWYKQFGQMYVEISLSNPCMDSQVVEIISNATKCDDKKA